MARKRSTMARKRVEDHYWARGQCLGGGADGEVVRGVCRSNYMWHALKYMSAKAYSVDREVDVLRHVAGHPNVVDLVGVFVTGGSSRAVLAFVEAGCSLDSFLGRRRGVISPHFSLSIVAVDERSGAHSCQACVAQRHQTRQCLAGFRHRFVPQHGADSKVG